MHIDKGIPNKATTTVDDKTVSGQATAHSATKATTMSVASVADSGTSAPSVASAATSKSMPSSALPEVTTKARDTSPTKMEIATEIFKRMRKNKGIMRKEIIEQFVAEAKLSNAGAATYYQLIKAKIK